MRYFRMGDPHDDFDRLDRMQAEAEARLPVCEDCGKRINEDYYFDVGGKILCEDCMNERFRRSTDDFVEAYD